MVAEKPYDRPLVETMDTPQSDGSDDSMPGERKSSDAASTSWAPDGGWGWMIVVAVFFGNFLIDGCAGSFGILYPELLDEFKASPATTSMAGSLIVAVYLFSSGYNCLWSFLMHLMNVSKCIVFLFPQVYESKHLNLTFFCICSSNCVSYYFLRKVVFFVCGLLLIFRH